MAAAMSSGGGGGSFLESVELAEDFTSSSNASGSGNRSISIHSPRISFSNEFGQLSEDPPPLQIKPVSPSISSIHNPSSSGEFEFTMNPSTAAAAAPVRNHPPMLSADELFYKGKLLPLHLPPRIRMVQDLSEVLQNPLKNPSAAAAGGVGIGKSPPLAVMRRERSLRSPPKPSVIASTLKSSSYPGYSSRPSSPPKSAKCGSSSGNSRWRDLFGLKKSISSPKSTAAASSSSSASSVPTKLLKMIFNRGGGGSSSTSSSGSGNVMHPSLSLLAEISDHAEAPPSSSANEALPLLRDSLSSSDHPEMAHSSSVSSSASSNWTASSASSSNASSSSFSADFPENLDQLPKKCDSKLGNPRSRGAIGPPPGRGRRSAAQIGRYASAPPQSGKSSGGLQRSGSGGHRRSAAAATSAPGSSGARMQLQDHVLIGKMRSSGAESSWRRSADHHHKSISGSGGSTSGGGGGGGGSNATSYSSSVRVTPVLHVPACIGPSLRSVRVHGLKRLFSSSSSASASNPPGKPQTVI